MDRMISIIFLTEDEWKRLWIRLYSFVVLYFLCFLAHNSVLLFCYLFIYLLITLLLFLRLTALPLKIKRMVTVLLVITRLSYCFYLSTLLMQRLCLFTQFCCSTTFSISAGIIALLAYIFLFYLLIFAYLFSQQTWVLLHCPKTDTCSTYFMLLIINNIIIEDFCFRFHN